MTRSASTAGIALALCAAFAGCSSRTNVSATGSTPAQFTHVFITTAEVWFNTNQDAGPDDSGWAKFPLKTPVTVDLVQQSNGTLGEVANDLRLAPGTYKTILLLPLISSTTAASATAIGATYNQEADFVDTITGNSAQVALVLPNPEKGIVVPGGTLTVPVGTTTSSGLGGANATTSNSASTLFGQPTTVNQTTTTTTTNNTNNTTTVSFASSFDGNRDIHLFNYNCASPLGAAGATLPACGNQTASQSVAIGAMLSSSPAATDLATTGGITGTLTLTSTTGNSALTNLNAASDRVAIQASAEALSADGTHHVIVATAPVSSEGTFTIYPLQSNSRNPTAYDVVIHGPTIATIIIKNVTVTTTPPATTPAASTTGAVGTTTASGAVSLGTLLPRAAKSSFFAQVSPTAAASLPPGAAVTFYQTLPASGEVPYAIDEVGIDPINLNLPAPELLSGDTIDTGTYSSSGSTITLTSAKPAENAGTYEVGATAPLFADGAISANTVVTATTGSNLPANTAPTPLPAVSPVKVSVPALSPANTAATGSITAAITSSGGSNQGQLLVSHHGAVIGSASLNGVLLNGGSVTISGLPSGAGNYYLAAISWNSSNPSGTFKYESVGSPVTVGAGGTTSVTVTIN